MLCCCCDTRIQGARSCLPLLVSVSHDTGPVCLSSCLCHMTHRAHRPERGRAGWAGRVAGALAHFVCNCSQLGRKCKRQCSARPHASICTPFFLLQASPEAISPEPTVESAPALSLRPSHWQRSSASPAPPRCVRCQGRCKGRVTASLCTIPGPVVSVVSRRFESALSREPGCVHSKCAFSARDSSPAHSASLRKPRTTKYLLRASHAPIASAFKPRVVHHPISRTGRTATGGDTSRGSARRRLLLLLRVRLARLHLHLLHAIHTPLCQLLQPSPARRPCAVCRVRLCSTCGGCTGTGRHWPQHGGHQARRSTARAENSPGQQYSPYGRAPAKSPPPPSPRAA